VRWTRKGRLGERKLNLLTIQHCSNGYFCGTGQREELTLPVAVLLRGESYRRNIGMAARDTILDRLTSAHQAENLARIYGQSIE
jgi:hypothetical protein